MANIEQAIIQLGAEVVLDLADHVDQDQRVEVELVEGELEVCVGELTARQVLHCVADQQRQVRGSGSGVGVHARAVTACSRFRRSSPDAAEPRRL